MKAEPTNYMSTELLNLLEKVSADSLIGWSIQCALRNGRQDELLDTLKEMADHNPGIIKEVIGKKALSLLKREHDW
ncbi:MAG TPA: hypothetical protein VFX58_18660 [Chitinophagaceae bacterium]|nr:hypothetical protein [Chitinophagaceae bacterium]